MNVLANISKESLVCDCCEDSLRKDWEEEILCKEREWRYKVHSLEKQMTLTSRASNIYKYLFVVFSLVSALTAFYVFVELNTSAFGLTL